MKGWYQEILLLVLHLQEFRVNLKCNAIFSFNIVFQQNNVSVQPALLLKIISRCQSKNYQACWQCFCSTWRTTPSMGGPRKCLMVEEVIDGNILESFSSSIITKWIDIDNIDVGEGDRRKYSEDFFFFFNQNIHFQLLTWGLPHSGKVWDGLSSSAELTVSRWSGGPLRSRYPPLYNISIEGKLVTLLRCERIFLNYTPLQKRKQKNTFANGERLRLSKACRSPALTWEEQSFCRISK